MISKAITNLQRSEAELSERRHQERRRLALNRHRQGALQNACQLVKVGDFEGRFDVGKQNGENVHQGREEGLWGNVDGAIG